MRRDVHTHLLAVKTQTMLCTDVVDFTSVLTRLGDVVAFSLMHRHREIVRCHTLRHGGSVRELRGDGHFCTFEDPDDAVAAGIAIQRDLECDRLAQEAGGLHLRIAAHTGKTLQDEDRVFGLDVVIAFRLADVAKTDSVLISRALHDQLRPESRSRLLCTDDCFALKGIPGLQAALEVDWRAH
jgi:class 3 adenylate cyclase